MLQGSHLNLVRSFKVIDAAFAWHCYYSTSILCGCQRAFSCACGRRSGIGSFITLAAADFQALRAAFVITKPALEIISGIE